MSKLLTQLSVAFLALLITWSAAAAQQPAPESGTEEEEGLYLSAEMKEMAKEQLKTQARLRTKVGKLSHRDYFLEAHRAMVEGNRKDYDLNKDRYQKALARANDLTKQNEENKAEAFKQLSELFRRAAEQNRAIVYAIVDPASGFDLDAALDEIKAIEKEYLELTKHRMQRSWVTPDEVEFYWQRTIGVQLQKQQRQNSGAQK